MPNRWLERNWWRLLLLSLSVSVYGAIAGIVRSCERSAAHSVQWQEELRRGPCRDAVIDSDGQVACPNKDQKLEPGQTYDKAYCRCKR